MGITTQKKWLELSVTNGDTKQQYVNVVMGGFPITFRVSSIFKWFSVITVVVGTIWRWVAPAINDFTTEWKDLRTRQEIMLMHDSLQTVSINELKEYVTRRNIQDKIDSALDANGMTETLIEGDKKTKIKGKTYRISNNQLGFFIEQWLKAENNKQ